MAAQGELFPDPVATLHVDSGRREPRLWVRRLALWERPGDLIRDIEFRSGLNIVWSPDPGPESAQVGRDAGSGHGAGKTLLCRLLRYCLGEETFANEDLRTQIVAAFPEGYVGIEAMIGGTPWAILRPFLPMRKHTAREGAVLEDLIDSKEVGTGMQPVLSALNKLLPSGIETNMPGQREWRSWLFALAWLSRDQECRLKQMLDWRDSAAQSGSPAVGSNQEELTVVVRSFLGMIESDELASKQERDRLSGRKQAVERDLSFLRRRTEQLRRSLTKSLDLDAESLQPGELGAAALHKTATENLEKQERQYVSTDSGNNIVRLREQLESVVREHAVVKQEVVRSDGILALHQEQLKVLRGERANLSAAEIKAKLGKICPICGVPIDRALAEGCGLSHVLLDPEMVATKAQDVAAQLAACDRAIVECQRRKSEQVTSVRRLKTREDELRRSISSAEEDARANAREQRQRWFEARNRLDSAIELKSMYGEERKLQRDLADIGDEDEVLRHEQQTLRRRHEQTMSRFEELFSYVSRGVLGNAAKSSLELAGRGFRGDVSVGGTAMESLKAVAFDLAALLMSIEGRSRLPAFLIHDSPREGDLGESHYQRLFRFMQSLEQLSPEPPFQYIVTTTSEPPKELRFPPQLVLKLHGAEIQDRLLRRDLH